MASVADALSIGLKIRPILTRLAEDTRIQQEFEQDKHLTGSLSLNAYTLNFYVEDCRTPDAAEYNPLEILEKIVSVLDNLTTDEKKRQYFQTMGCIRGRFSSNGYKVEFTAVDNAKVVQADIEPAKEEEE